MNTPLFSILVPVYNVESYIREALDSILAQDFDDYEVILIDDGSTDSSGSICDEFQSKYPEKFFVVHKKNEGLISARREGIKRATGRYSIFLDSDDMLESNCLSTLHEIIHGHADVDMIIYGLSYLYMDTHQKVPGATVFKDLEVFEKDRKELYRQLVYSTRINNLVIKAISTELLQSDPTDYSVYYKNAFGEDMLQTLYPITYAKKIIYSTSKLYLYRIHSSSMIHVFNAEKMEMRYKCSWDGLAREYMHKWGIDSELDFLLEDASKCKNMVDTITYCWGDKTNDKAAMLKFVTQYLEAEKSKIAKFLDCKEVSLSWRIAFKLFSLRKMNLLVLYYHILKLLITIKNRSRKQ